MARDIDEKESEENFNSTELTETLGKLRMVTKPSQLDKIKMLEQMIQEELALRLPTNLNRYMLIFCFSTGIYVFYNDFKSYYKRLSSPEYRSIELEPYFEGTP